MFLGYALYAGGIWKGDVLIADLEELETMDASEIYSKEDPMQRKYYFTKFREGLRHCTRNWRSTRPSTTIKSNEMKPMNLQEEVKELEEQTRRVESSLVKVTTRRKSHRSMVRL